jgi:hypothetical protein
VKPFVRIRAAFAAIVALAALTALAALGNPAPAQPAKGATTFIGTLPADPPARVAIVIEGDRFLAYACGQTDDFNKAASAWFSGTIQNGKIEAKNDGKTLSATLADGKVRGSLTIPGREREFTAKPVSANAIAGLYRAAREVKGDTVVMGWIVDAQHQVVGGCQSKRQLPVALKPAKPLPPPPPPPTAEEPPPDPPAEQKKEAQELIIGQIEEEPGVALQGEKVTSATKPPAGKVVRSSKK